EALRAAFGAARVAVDFDEAVGKIYGGVILHPVFTELQPVGKIAGLVVANQVADDLGLLRLGELLRTGQIFVRLLQVGRVKARRDAAVWSAGAIRQLLQLAVGAADRQGIARVLLH